MARTEQESDSRRREVADFMVLLRLAKSMQNGAGFSGKNLNILGLSERKEWPLCHRESRWQGRRSCLCQKEKEQSDLSRVPDHEGGRESRWARAAPWQERGGSEWEHGEERVDSMMKEGRF